MLPENEFTPDLNAPEEGQTDTIPYSAVQKSWHPNGFSTNFVPDIYLISIMFPSEKKSIFGKIVT